MVYTAVIVLVAVVTAIRASPRALTRIGAGAVVAGVLSGAAAAASGNVLLLYLGSLAVMYGVVVLVVRAVRAIPPRRRS